MGEDLTPQAAELLASINRDRASQPIPLKPWTASDLVGLRAEQLGWAGAWEWVFGVRPLASFPSDWKEFAREKRKAGWSYRHITMLVQTVYGRSCRSEIMRACDPEYASRQREYDRAYRRRQNER